MSRKGAEKSEVRGTLYVVATPIGNLEDLSPRAVRILKEVDQIACEDTRHTGKLLAHFDIRTPTTSYHEHNEELKAPTLVEALRQGKTLALVSDAGTPLLSDPGYRLVLLCRQKSIPVVPIPGPFAAAAALSVSGLPTDRFLFAGFLPRKGGELQQQLKQLARLQATLVFYLSPHGLKKTLSTILAELGDRKVFLIREMTKLHETCHWGMLSRISDELELEAGRGEYTLVVEGALQRQVDHSRVDIAAYISGLIHTGGLTRTEAVKQACRDLGLTRAEVYRIASEKRDR